MASVAVLADDVVHNWSDEGTSVRIDVLCFALALLLHIPLYYVRIAGTRHSVEHRTDRLVSVDLLENLEQPKPAETPAPAAAPAKESLMDRLKMLVKRAPPPPAPVVQPKPVEPPKPVEAPKPIALQPKLDVPAPQTPKLENKVGFKTTLPPDQVAAKQLALANAPPAGIAPLSAQKLGAITDRGALKQDKGNFQINQKDQISSIDTGKPALAGVDSSPALQIRTGSSGRVEKFSAPPPQMTDKGHIGAVPSGGLSAPMGLRDRIIARDAASNQIAGVNGVQAAGGGLPMPAVATKRDAGRFDPSAAGVGALPTSIGSASRPAPAAIAPPKPREKKSMFTITGPLSDRQILKQVAPEYPAWAQAQGIEAAVVLEFTVDSAGNVKPNVIVRRTSGYQKLDDTAIEALRQWKFVPLSEANRDEVGLITFNYSLH